MKISYGSQETTQILDDEGSTQTKSSNFYDGGKTSKPVRNRYKIKAKVRNQREEHEEYLKFSNDLQNDKTMLDPAFEIEHTKAGNLAGYYYVVKCYTKLEY